MFAGALEVGISWSRSFGLFNSDHHLELRDKCGVYRIRVFNVEAKSVPIARLNGVDELGILHIGKSINLGVRIRTFRQAAEGKSAPHPAGRAFRTWEFEKVFPKEWLRFDYTFTSTDEESLRLESSLHEEYRRRYLDRPPLDGQSGQSVE